MLIILVILLAIVGYLVYNSGGSATANQAAPTTGIPDISTTNVYQNASLQQPGLSPIDIGGISLTVPNAVLQWQDLANKYAQKFSILDPEEILAIIWNESSGNPNATNPSDPSWGLMGVTLLISKAYGGVSDASLLLDPETNIRCGSAYLAYLKNKFGDSSDWSESYNEGETNYNAGKHYNPGYSQAFNSHLLALKGIG